ncbi:hypothetical protein CRE_13766 [Caenorhabditis remanei]|uniref:DNA-directed DNA polymerase n=1 Tax=Caenorhabditis remanei TaxID=31234 RepID=E3NJM4_CAERE|nr:hypothetical protein CRE_13766 [Caenorhabditis remanei]
MSKERGKPRRLPTHGMMKGHSRGVYTTVELHKAPEHGGTKFLEVFHAIEYKYWVGNDAQGQGGLFTSYINKMMVEKIHASGWPGSVKTDEEKDAFIKGYRDMEGIELEADKMEKNPGKRTVSKLLLNSLWGKTAQRVDKTNTSIIIDPAKFYRILYDKTVEIQDVRAVNDTLVVKHQKRAECLESLRTSAMHIAAMTTSHARLHLYRLMEKVGADNLVYTDTDSLIYTVPDGEEDPLKEDLGKYLGDLTSELSGKMKEFVTLGPKTYSYKQEMETGEEKISLKAKGFTMTSAADKIVTFDNMKTMVQEVLEEVTPRTVQKVPQFTMRRDREHNVYARDIEKQMKYTFNKRRVLSDGSTLPFGYRHK